MGEIIKVFYLIKILNGLVSFFNNMEIEPEIFNEILKSEPIIKDSFASLCINIEISFHFSQIHLFNLSIRF